jgi:tetratricopeptide (TPR) repeat protein
MAARDLEKKGEFVAAKNAYVRAKDLDALRFRAPEEFNTILRDLAKKYSLPIVATAAFFEKESPNRIIGNHLILEHLHPNKEGYFLLAEAFYGTMKEWKMIGKEWPLAGIEKEKNEGVTELDSVYGALCIRHLKAGWPFQARSLPNRFMDDFRPSNYIEEIAFRVIRDPNYSLEVGHMELGKYYEKQGELDKAFLEYNALIASIPHEMEFYQKAVTVLIRQKEYDNALRLLFKSLEYKENLFADKWIGQIALMRDDFETAISYLKKADLLDQQVLFNLSRACYMNNQWDDGEKYYMRLRNLAPRSEYAAYLTKLRVSMQFKQRKVQH